MCNGLLSRGTSSLGKDVVVDNDDGGGGSVQENCKLGWAHGRSEPVLHIESRHRSLLVFCSGVHQISWSRGRVVDADSFINLMRHRIFEEPLCLERELAFFSLVEKLLMFIKSVVLLSCLQARLVLVLPSNEASMRPSMIL